MRKAEVVGQYRYTGKEANYYIEVLQCGDVYGFVACGGDGAYNMWDFGFATRAEALGVLLFNISIGDTLLED